MGGGRELSLVLLYRIHGGLVVQQDDSGTHQAEEAGASGGEGSALIPSSKGVGDASEGDDIASGSRHVQDHVLKRRDVVRGREDTAERSTGQHHSGDQGYEAHCGGQSMGRAGCWCG